MEKNKLDLAEEILKLSNSLSKRVRGQPRAIETVCNLIEDDKTLSDIEGKKGPIGIVLFLGPSGVGKTELARAAAECIMGSEHYLTKIECVTLSQPHTIQLLLGAPPSYVGYDKPPLLSPDKIFRKSKPGDAAPTNPKTALLQEQKTLLTARVKQIRKEQSDMQREWWLKLNQLKLIEESFTTLDDLTDLLAKINEEGTRKSVALKSESYNKLLRIVNISSEEVSIFISQNEESQVKLGLLLAELKKINDALKKNSDATNAVGDKNSDIFADMGIILFDEIERADTTIHNLLLQIGEEGSVTLANGVQSNLKKALIILTSNIGARAIGDVLKEKSIGFTSKKSIRANHAYYDDNELEDLEKKILDIASKELEKRFPPEFIGRLDAVVVFRPLSRATFMQILNDQIEMFDLALRLKMNTALVVEDAVKEKVLQSSLHRPESGARLLSHKLKSMLKRPLGRMLARNPGFNGTVRAYLNKDTVDFEFTPKAPKRLM